MNATDNTAIAKGWRLGVISPDGMIVDTVDLEGYDLNRPAAGIALGYEIRDALPAEAVTS
jgi:hypothetical protein